MILKLGFNLYEICFSNWLLLQKKKKMLMMFSRTSPLWYVLSSNCSPPSPFILLELPFTPSSFSFTAFTFGSSFKCHSSLLTLILIQILASKLLPDSVFLRCPALLLVLSNVVVMDVTSYIHNLFSDMLSETTCSATVQWKTHRGNL